jgi:hypothetical protein
VSHYRDHGGRESNREYNQTSYWGPIVSEISKGSVISCIEQHGCDEECQRKFRWNGERGRAWKKRKQGAAESQKHGIRCSDAARQRRENHGGDEQNKKLFEVLHISDLSDSARHPSQAT